MMIFTLLAICIRKICIALKSIILSEESPSRLKSYINSCKSNFQITQSMVSGWTTRIWIAASATDCARIILFLTSCKNLVRISPCKSSCCQSRCHTGEFCGATNKKIVISGSISSNLLHFKNLWIIFNGYELKNIFFTGYICLNFTGWSLRNCVRLSLQSKRKEKRHKGTTERNV